jgi:hypothetical protein
MTVGPEGSTRKERKLDELSHARSEGSSGSSKLAGRCDNSTYAEAMQCVADLTDVVSVKNAHNRRATNQIEAFLLTDIEESSDSSRSDSMSSVHLGPRKARGSVSDDAMAPPPVEEAMDVGHGPEEQQPVPPVAGDDDDEVRPPGLHQWLVRRIFIACVVGLIMLAPSIATIALYASDPFDEEVEFPPTFAQANLGQIFELILRPVYALATAYLATKLLASFIMNARVQRWIPGFLLLFMHHTFNLGWALPAVLYPAAIGFFYGIGADDEAWDFLVDLRHFVATALWLMAWGLCSAILDSSVAFLQRHLTLHHYEQRSQTAYDTQRCLRKIVAAAHAAKRQAEKVRDKSVEAAAGVLQVRMRQFAQHVARERLLRRSSRTSANSSRSATNLPNSASATSLPQSASANGLPTSASANALPTSISGTALPLSASAKSLPSMATPRPPDLHKELKEPKEYKEPKEPKEHKELKEYHEQRKVLPPPELEVKIVRTLSEHVAEHERSKKPPAPPPRSASKAKLFPDAAAAEARAAAPPAKNNPPRAGIRSKELDRQLDILSGPLDLGPGIMAAKTFSQAGRRAIKVFRTLMAQDVLRVPQPETMEPAIDRDRLVAWAYRDGGKKPSSRLAGNVFRYGNAITMEEFIQVFERSYQEQRLITASVAAFDRLHSEVRVFLQVILCLVFLILLLAVWSVSVVTWLVPIGSAVLSISVLAGGITGDILDCFFFACAPPANDPLAHPLHRQLCRHPPLHARCLPPQVPTTIPRPSRLLPPHINPCQGAASSPKLLLIQLLRHTLHTRTSFMQLSARRTRGSSPRLLPCLPPAAAVPSPTPALPPQLHHPRSPPSPPTGWPPSAATSSGRTTSATAWPSRPRPRTRRCCRASSKTSS